MKKSKIYAVSKNHVIVKQTIRGVVGINVPALYFDVSGRPILVNSLISFFLANPDRSMTWMRNHSRALGLFYDYCSALYSGNTVPLGYQDTLTRFCISVANGTINPNDGSDELRLFWPPSSIENAKRIANAMQGFIVWCTHKGLVPEDFLIKGHQLPTDEKTYIRYLFQANKAKSFSFLGHTLKASDIAKRMVRDRNSKSINFATSTSKLIGSKNFPNQYVSKLLNDGFVRNHNANTLWEREDITAKMITILMLFGGTRHSEPYHLWFNDVIPQIDGSCKVFLRHPSESLTYLAGEQEKSRKQYLNELGLLPRNNNSNTKSYKAGWKSLQVNEEYSAAVQFIHPKAEKMFRELYLKYLKYYRPNLLKQRLQNGGYQHPFLFINNWVGDIGAPYSMAAYKAALDRAYQRINRKHGTSIRQSKMSGTSPHGMRHFYGQALTDLGVNEKIIQRCLRHRTIEAQSVYTEPNAETIKKELDAARQRIRDVETNQITKVFSEF